MHACIQTPNSLSLKIQNLAVRASFLPGIESQQEWRIAEMEREPLDASERSEMEVSCLGGWRIRSQAAGSTATPWQDLDDMLVIQKLCGGQREAIVPW